MKLQLQFDEAVKLVNAYEREEIIDVLNAMENKVNLTRDYKSVYLTINNWCKRSTKSNTKNKFQQYWSLAYQNTLQPAELQKWWQFLRENGSYPVHDDKGNVTHWAKK